MKTMKWISKGTNMLAAAVMLLAVSAGALEPVSALSGAAAVDTRTMSRVLDVDDKPLDSRSYTIDWSIAGTLNTKKIIGTILLIR